MAIRTDLPLETTHEVRDRCLCLHLQRAARAIGRRFDDALKPFGLTNGQYSILVALNRPEPPRLGAVARLLAMDRSTLTAAMKPLVRRRLAAVDPDPDDRRGRLLRLTDDGRAVLADAVPIWRATHDRIDRLVADDGVQRLRSDLLSLAFGEPDADPAADGAARKP